MQAAAANGALEREEGWAAVVAYLPTMQPRMPPSTHRYQFYGTHRVLMPPADGEAYLPITHYVTYVCGGPMPSAIWPCLALRVVKAGRERGAPVKWMDGRKLHGHLGLFHQ